jgi:ornithine cyclodeaminase/alanine dehydrogenase-like protein (mu-crystallin family)
VTLLLREADVQALLPMTEALRLVKDSLTELAKGDAANQPRRRVRLGSGFLNVMFASIPPGNSAGLKSYTASRHGARFIAALWDSNDGTLLALFEADWLGRIRTGAASGVATDALARQDASVAALIGTGRQAETQLRAIAAVRRLAEVRVFSRHQENRDAFAAKMRAELGLNVAATETARDAVEPAEIVTAITGSATPVVEGAWLQEGAHVNAVGSNWADRREVDTEAVTRASVVTVDSLEQAREEAGDICIPIAEGALTWDNVREIGAILAGQAPGRGSDRNITLFKSIGVAVEDVAVARFVYDRAVEEGRGETTSFGGVAG